MTTKFQDIPFASFLRVSIIGNLFFAIPVLSSIILFKLIDIIALFFVIIPFILFSIPINAVFAWLIAKGSNWVNTPAAITAISSVPGRFYGFLFGGYLGFHLFNLTGAIIGAILFYLLALTLTIPLGRYLSRKIINEAVSN